MLDFRFAFPNRDRCRDRCRSRFLNSKLKCSSETKIFIDYFNRATGGLRSLATATLDIAMLSVQTIPSVLPGGKGLPPSSAGIQANNENYLFLADKTLPTKFGALLKLLFSHHEDHEVHEEILTLKTLLSF